MSLKHAKRHKHFLLFPELCRRSFPCSGQTPRLLEGAGVIRQHQNGQDECHIGFLIG